MFQCRGFLHWWPTTVCAPLHMWCWFLCVSGVPGGDGRGQILQPEAWRRQNSRHQAEQEGWVHTAVTIGSNSPPRQQIFSLALKEHFVPVWTCILNCSAVLVPLIEDELYCKTKLCCRWYSPSEVWNRKSDSQTLKGTVIINSSK